jgi:hypothetical protein
MRSILCLALCGPAFSGTLTFTGTATGTIGSTPFTDAMLTVSAPADLSTVMCAAGTCDVIIGAGFASFTINGVSSGTFTDPTYFFDNQTSTFYGTPAGMVGFGDGGDLIQMYGALIGTSVFATYNLQSAIGPLGPQFSDPSALSWASINTSLGAFSVTSFSNFTFQVSDTAPVATAPEPASFALLGAGLCAILARNFKFRRPR